MMVTFLHIDPAEKQLFQEQGLDQFEVLMNNAVGELVSCDDHGRELRKLTIPGGASYYIKRIEQEPLRLMVGMVLSAHRPESGPMRERRLLKCLKAAGFAVMEPVAWGEKRVWGIPVCGFLVVREVPGQEVAALFDAADATGKRELMEAVGQLVGQLHAKGFFQPVRLKDLIRTENSLVLIDRETSKPWPTFFMRIKCIRSLTRAFRRTIRDGHKIGAGSASAFLRGYRQGLAGRWHISANKLAHVIIKNLRSELH